MLGAARYWVDSTDQIFQTWPQFTERFLNDFPCLSNPADVHLKMSKTNRDSTESPSDYFYKMLALGKKGNLVVVENEPAATGESRKLEPRYRGPYIVVKVLGNDRYVIEDIPGIQITGRKYSSVYSSDKIKPWCSNVPELDVPDDDEDRIEDDPNAGLAELSRVSRSGSDGEPLDSNGLASRS
nr:uncharacterized protein LOC121502671 [Drosophila kikkawai]XP_041633177.1 uncharacterized protein LOC121503111 [Drosophila kikkawai]